MNVLKIWYHLCAYIKKIVFLIIYGKKVKFGVRNTWRKGFSIMASKEAKVIIGDHCFFNNYCSINANTFIQIGDGTIIGENVKIYDHNHKFNKKNVVIRNQGYSNGKVVIGKNCWIGSNVVILKDTIIGDECVIGAGCVVSGEIPKKSIVTCSNRELTIMPIISK